jgi:hypothetical protein
MPWYRDGTISVTLNSSTVTGAATRWISQARVGDGLIGPDGRVYEVVNIASDTSLKIDPPYKSATAAAQPYAISPIQGYVRTLADQAARILNEVGPTLNGKVDKVEGMGLSANDYTTTEKQKLAGVDAGAKATWNDGVQIPSGVDLNSYIAPGMYAARSGATATSLANSPTKLRFSLLVYQDGGLGFITQILIEGAVGTAPAGKVFRRSFDSTSWGTWREFAFLDGTQTWTGQQTLQHAGNVPLVINTASGLKAGEIKPAVVVGGLSFMGQSSEQSVFMDFNAVNGKDSTYRFGRVGNNPVANCRIPDDCIDKNRYPLFIARDVLRELVQSLQSTGSL